MVRTDGRRDGNDKTLSVLALSSRFDGPISRNCKKAGDCDFQYSLCRVVLMVGVFAPTGGALLGLSVLALSSRFDGRSRRGVLLWTISLSVLALSSRFDGHTHYPTSSE